MTLKTSTAEQSAPLSFMKPLNAALSFFDPDNQQQASASSSPDPALILVFTWMNAQDLHVAKYIQQHRALFPSSRILLVQNTLGQFMRAGHQRRLLGPAMPVLREVAAAQSDAKLLVHVFSNGGVSSMTALWKMIQEDSQGGETFPPKHVVIMDSCPGYHTWQHAHFAVASSLPVWVSPLVHLFLTAVWLLHVPFGRIPPQDRNAEAMLAPKFFANEIRRTYLYGTGDQAVAYTDVEGHAKRAAEEGGIEVRLEKFEGGRHVALTRVDAERYWRIVKESWEGCRPIMTGVKGTVVSCS